jgi:hypothetical protein
VSKTALWSAERCRLVPVSSRKKCLGSIKPRRKSEKSQGCGMGKLPGSSNTDSGIIQ